MGLEIWSRSDLPVRAVGGIVEIISAVVCPLSTRSLRPSLSAISCESSRQEMCTGTQIQRDSGPAALKKLRFGLPRIPVYCHAAESGRRWDELSLLIPDLCPCAIQSRPFGLPYGLFFTTQGPESYSCRHTRGSNRTYGHLLDLQSCYRLMVLDSTTVSLMLHD